MPRPREFDEKEVLDRALDVFWAKGFEGTSIQDLVDATGLARASLYGAFGDKEGLYERVVAHYVARVDDMTCELDPSLGTRETLDAVLASWLGRRCDRVTSRGCFLAVAGIESEEPAGFAREALVASQKKREKLLTQIFRRGIERGDIPRDRDPVTLARLLVVLLQGVADSARAGWPAERLQKVIDGALDLVVSA